MQTISFLRDNAKGRNINLSLKGNKYSSISLEKMHFIYLKCMKVYIFWYYLLFFPIKYIVLF